MKYKWRDINDWPELDGWIWLTTGTKGEGSKIRPFYFKREDQIKHGHIKIKDTKVGTLNSARYWMYPIPIIKENINSDKMKDTRLVILDYTQSRIITIILTQELQAELAKYKDAEDYVVTLENDYGFRMKDIYWMISDNLSTETYFGKKEI